MLHVGVWNRKQHGHLRLSLSVITANKTQANNVKAASSFTTPWRPSKMSKNTSVWLCAFNSRPLQHFMRTLEKRTTTSRSYFPKHKISDSDDKRQERRTTGLRKAKDLWHWFWVSMLKDTPRSTSAWRNKLKRACGLFCGCNACGIVSREPHCRTASRMSTCGG